MRSRLVSTFLTVLIGSTCLLGPGLAQAGKKLSFAIIGDTPYDARQRKEFGQLMNVIDTENLAFVVHAGDFWFDGIAWKNTTLGLPPCSDEVFDDRLALAQQSKHPFIFTPGDNDWTDCYRARPKTYNPAERLAKLRKMFFSGDRSLGRKSIRLTRQSEYPGYAMYRENASWQLGGVQFATLHMTGSNNNLGRTPEMDEEFRRRNAANLVWLKKVFASARHSRSKAVVIVSQANPFFENNWSPKLRGRYLLKGLDIKATDDQRITGFDDFLEAIEQETVAFGKPVVYVHGDTHTFRIDKPLVYTPKGSRFVENFTRVETFGFPSTHWIRATIDPSDPNVISFRPEIVPANRSAK